MIEKTKQAVNNDKGTQVAKGRKRSAPKAKPVAVVGIGSSAGGLEALRELAGALSLNSGNAYVVAQHLSPTHRSMMVDLLSRATKVPVVQAKSGAILRPDTIYVVPPNTDVKVIGGKLTFGDFNAAHSPKPSIDALFISLAEALGENATGVILSGTGSDGTSGARAIRAAGGVTMAQAPDTAKYESMPGTAIRHGLIDLVLPPAQIGAQLSIPGPNALLKQPRSVSGSDHFNSLLLLVERHVGTNFTGYRENTLRRQIERRMARMRMTTFQAYLDYVRETPKELDTVAARFLISVTSFFRDEAAFKALAGQLEQLVAGKEAGDEIRVWVPGCAYGQEAFTIAMLLDQAIVRADKPITFKIYATDINKPALAAARRGVFSPVEAAAVPEELREEYFEASGQHSLVKKRLRDMIVFAPHDVLRDPPFPGLDLVSCRNLLIYFKTPAQERCLKVFHYALAASGLLLLGKSESCGQMSDLFQPADGKNHLYRKAPAELPAVLSFSGSPTLRSPAPRRSQLPAKPREAAPLPDQMRRALFDAFVPATVCVDDDLRCLQIFGEVAFLTVRSGRPDLNLVRLCPPEMRSEVRLLTRRALAGSEPVKASPIAYFPPGSKKKSWMQITARGLKSEEESRPMALVSFQPVDAPASARGKGRAEGRAAESVKSLERELELTREHADSLVEELEAANEELQAGNEELQATGEELQASNEELETSNEELQSTNEELTTVNEELRVRTTEAEVASADLENVQAALRVPLLIVGGDRRLRRASASARTLFEINANDLHGASASVVFRRAFSEPDLEIAIDDVIRKGDEHVASVATADKPYLLRITPVIDRMNGQIDGAVITLVDVSEVLEARRAAEANAQLFRAAARASQVGTSIHSPEGACDYVNPAFARLLERSEEQLLGVSIHDLVAPEHREGWTQAWMATLEAGAGSFAVEVDLLGSASGRVPVKLHAMVLSPEGSRGRRVLVEAINRTEVKAREEVLLGESRRAQSEKAAALAVTAAKSEFLAKMSHEIRTPMNGIVGMLDLLKREPLQPDHAAMVNALNRAAGDLSQLLDDVLDFSRVESGRLRLQQQSMDPRNVVESALETMFALAQKKKLSLSCRVFPAVPAEVVGDPLRVRQIVLNLVSNAIKFTSTTEGRAGSISVEVDARQLKAEKRVTLIIRVTDNGIGVPRSTQARVFQAFVQADEGSKRRFGGSGLGLAICRQLTNLMKGSIRLKSAPGEGSTFTVEIPLPVVAMEPRPFLEGVRVLWLSQERPNQDIVEHLRAVGAECHEQGPPLDAGAQDPSKSSAYDVIVGQGVSARLLRSLRGDAAAGSSPHLIYVSDGASDEPSGAGHWAGVRRSLPLGGQLAQEIGELMNRVEDKRSVPDSAAGNGAPPPRPTPQSRVVLVVDDNEVNRDVACRQLSNLGHRCIAVRDGREALAQTEAHEIDLVLSDVHMPGMDGFALAQELRRRESPGEHLPLLAWTAAVLPEEVARCRQHGFDDVVAKPMVLEELQEALARWLPGREVKAVEPSDVLSEEALARYVGTDPSALNSILPKVSLIAVEVARSIRAQAERGDIKGIVESLHNLKSSVATVGARALTELCRDLERDLRAGARKDVLSIAAEVEGEVARVVEAIAARSEETRPAMSTSEGN